MARLSAYQKRKREILYLEQCIRELEDKCRDLAKCLREKGGAPTLTMKGISGDDFITPYNNGEFDFEL